MAERSTRLLYGKALALSRFSEIVRSFEDFEEMLSWGTENGVERTSF